MGRPRANYCPACGAWWRVRPGTTACGLCAWWDERPAILEHKAGLSLDKAELRARPDRLVTFSDIAELDEFVEMNLLDQKGGPDGQQNNDT